MKAIWKYPLKAAEKQTIALPKGAMILCVQLQRNTPCLWVEVDPKAEHEYRIIERFGTGDAITEEMFGGRRYVGTYQLLGGSVIYHVYERVQGRS